MTIRQKILRSRYAGPVSIAAICAIVALVRWVVLDNLITTDPPMWLYQSARFAWGEFPYRDFSYNYSPLSLLVVGEVLRWLGVKFWVAAFNMDVLAALNVAVAYRLARRLMPPFFAWVSVVFLLGICTTSLTKYNLFSFSAYSPSLLFASLGLLLVMLTGVEWLREGPSPWRIFWLATGSFIAMSSKQEALVTALGALVLLAFLEAKSRSDRGIAACARLYAGVFLVCGLPAALLYVGVAREAGLRSFLDGLGGYGLASITCPWWPTGYGALGGLAALGNAAVLLTVLLIPFRRTLPERWGRAYRRLLLFLPVGILAWLTYLWLQNRTVLNWPVPLKQRLLVCVPTLFWTNPVLLMAMWSSLLLVCYLLWDLVRKRGAVEAGRRELLFVFAVPAAISLRGLFLTTLTPITEVSALCYPFFCIVGPYLLWLVIRGISGGQASDGKEEGLKWKYQAPFAGVLLAYALLRFGGAYATGALAPGHWQPLETEAGLVRLGDGGASAEAYRYVVDHTGPNDLISEIPYGGGLGFAAHRRPALFTNQFTQLKMPESYQQRDVAQMKAHPAALVVVVDNPLFGTEYGIQSYLGCPCPRLVWLPDRFSGVPRYVFPIVSYLQTHYRAVSRFGRDGLILAPQPSAIQPR
jgi:hypothetical protein